MTSNSCAITNSVTPAVVPRFVQSVYDILEKEDHRILSWSADGSHFQVYDVARLEHEVLPKYYNHCRFSSFQRQLNKFGFRKWTKTRAKVATFSHEHLHRCHPSELAALMVEIEQCKISSCTGTKRKIEAELENECSKRSKTVLTQRATQQQDGELRGADLVEPSGQCAQNELQLQALDTLDWISVSSLGQSDMDVAVVPLTEEDVSAMLSGLSDEDVLLECEVDDLFGTIAERSSSLLFFS